MSFKCVYYSDSTYIIDEIEMHVTFELLLKEKHNFHISLKPLFETQRRRHVYVAMFVPSC